MTEARESPIVLLVKLKLLPGEPECAQRLKLPHGAGTDRQPQWIEPLKHCLSVATFFTTAIGVFFGIYGVGVDDLFSSSTAGGSFLALLGSCAFGFMFAGATKLLVRRWQVHGETVGTRTAESGGEHDSRCRSQLIWALLTTLVGVAALAIVDTMTILALAGKDASWDSSRGVHGIVALVCSVFSLLLLIALSGVEYKAAYDVAANQSVKSYLTKEWQRLVASNERLRAGLEEVAAHESLVSGKASHTVEFEEKRAERFGQLKKVKKHLDENLLPGGFLPEEIRELTRLKLIWLDEQRKLDAIDRGSL